MMIKEEIKKIIEKAIENTPCDFSIEVPGEKNHGDYSTNVALVLAKKIGKNPIEIANSIKEKINNNIFKKIEVANPGFINFFISDDYFKKQLPVILKEKNKFGTLKIGKNKKVNIEFISANPTGPLTLGNGRGGFGGDVLANVLQKAGYKVSREYYVNDIGAQIKKLGHSVIGDSEAVYKGEYVDDLWKKIKGDDPEKVGQKAAKEILDKQIKPLVKDMGIKFDVWFSEKSLYKNKEIDKVIDELTKKGFTYKSEGATWFKSKDLGDDKDRVLIRADGIKTYFASDLAYLKNKFGRGFDKLIIFLGADHHGYVARFKAGAHALGFRKEDINMIVLQLVRIFNNGKERRMSKRAGIYITIGELINEVSLDVARFFFLQRSLNTHFNFDMDLAREKSKKNPVFKVQYAYARICSVIKKSKIKSLKSKVNYQLLEEASELSLMKQFVVFLEVIKNTAEDYQMQRIPQYAIELTDAFHNFYENCQVINEDKELSQARLALVLATKIVLKNTLDLMGVSAPEKM